jgi:hypothetical protein
MKHRVSGVGGCAVLLLLAGPAAAAEWWVDQNASAGGDGTQGSPFQTINDVRSVLHTGDTVWIMDGTYLETVDFWHVSDGGGGRTTISAAPGHSPVIDGGGASGFVLQAGETDRMTFRGLTVRNGGSAFHFYYAHEGQVIDCITEAVGSGVSFYHANQGYVSGCTIEGSISGKESDGTILEDNEIFGSGAEGITLHADSKNCRYSRNVVHDNHSVNIYLDSISHTLVERNLVYMTNPTSETTVGIMLADESYDNVTAPVLTDITIVNNVVIDNESGIRFWDGHFPGSSGLKNVVIANNTVINNRTSAIKWDAGAHENTVVQNNLFAAESGAGLLMLQANSLTGVTLDHNLWYLPGVGSPFLWGNDSYDHAGWASATGHGTGDVTSDPLLAAAWELPATNLQLQQTSPAVDAGTVVADVSDDFEGGARPTGAAYDLGAFEYGSEPAGGGGQGGAGGAGASAGTGGTATGGGAGQGGTGASAGPAADEGDDGGCGCRARSPRGQSRSAQLLLLMGLAVALARRFRCRRG